MKSTLTIILLVISLHCGAQIYPYLEGSRAIITAAYYLQLAPDARSTGIGNSGVASSADVFSMHWNPAKYSFIDDRFGIAVSYTGYFWMKEIWEYNNLYEISIGFNTLNSYYKLNERSALAYSFTYFNATGEIVLTDLYGNFIGVYKPLDINMDLAYSYRFSNTLSAAVAGRYIFSRLTTTQFVQGGESHNANAVAFDLALYYQKPLELGSREGEFRWGVNISNIGMKMSYVVDDDDRNFLPANLRLGAGLTYNFSDDHSLSFQFDANKLLVPTPPVYLRDSMGYPVFDSDNNPVIAKGMDPNVSVCKGMIQSWYDAPGGFQEEMQEWALAGGFEYRLKNTFSARSGIFYEHKTKGTRRFFTVGAGFRIGVFGLDLGLNIPIDVKMATRYMSVFYFRSSVALDKLAN